MTKLGQLACAALLAGLGACGGGGGAPPATPQPSGPSVAGLYTGTASGGRSVDALILDSGRMYAMVGGAAGGGGIGTIFFGSGTLSASGFTSTVGGNLDTHSGAPLTPGSVALTGEAKKSIAGTLSGNGVTMLDFNLPYSAAIEGTASLADVAGSYLGDSSGLGRIISASITVDAAGALTGQSAADGCVLSGTLTPNASANALDLSLSFGANCPKRGELRGHALWRAASGTLPATLTMFASSDLSRANADAWAYFAGKR